MPVIKKGIIGNSDKLQPLLATVWIGFKIFLATIWKLFLQKDDALLKTESKFWMEKSNNSGFFSFSLRGSFLKIVQFVRKVILVSGQIGRHWRLLAIYRTSEFVDLYTKIPTVNKISLFAIS